MNSADIQKLIELDRAGFIPAPQESIDDFFARVELIRQTGENFNRTLDTAGSADVFNFVRVNAQDRIDETLVQCVESKTMELYGFAVHHVPGFYLTKAVGLLWGGCMLYDPDEHLSIFLLRNAFRKHRRFLNYTREELLAHELCHSARQALGEPTLEEYFAYQTSSSALRRYFGNCFISDKDALLFLLPMLLLPVAGVAKVWLLPGLPLWIFWLLAALYPAYLLFRNARSLRIVKRAAEALSSFNVAHVKAVLFRSTVEELKTIAALDKAGFDSFVAEKAASELRWTIIARRFINDTDEAEQGENTRNEN